MKETKAETLIDQIRSAFSDVKLGQGVGLFEGQAIDDYETPEVRAEARVKDEKENWERIEVKHLNACNSSLSFFDSMGMRFHLPAFLIGELQGTYICGVLFHLTELTDYGRSKFTDLNVDQRRAVRDFLLFIRDDPDQEFYHPEIDRALAKYWKEE